MRPARRCDMVDFLQPPSLLLKLPGPDGIHHSYRTTSHTTAGVHNQQAALHQWNAPASRFMFSPLLQGGQGRSRCQVRLRGALTPQCQRVLVDILVLSQTHQPCQCHSRRGRTTHSGVWTSWKDGLGMLFPDAGPLSHRTGEDNPRLSS
jgi:hypothetical protein